MSRNAKDYFFLVGCPRSGTRLLGELLDRHSRLAVPPETAFFEEVAPQLATADDARLLKVLRGWRRLPELEIDAKDVVRKRPSTAAGVLAVLLDLYAQSRGKSRCGEKTPEHLRHASTILRRFPKAKVICMLRDGRDSVLSLRSMPTWRGSLAAGAEIWKDSVIAAEQLALREPDRFMLLRYEDLVLHTEDVLRHVMRYLGEPFEQTQLHAPGVVSLEAHRVDHRRRAATPRELICLEVLLRDQLRRHGYA